MAADSAQRLKSFLIPMVRFRPALAPTGLVVHRTRDTEAATWDNPYAFETQYIGIFAADVVVMLVDSRTGRVVAVPQT